MPPSSLSPPIGRHKTRDTSGSRAWCTSGLNGWPRCGLSVQLMLRSLLPGCRDPLATVCPQPAWPAPDLSTPASGLAVSRSVCLELWVSGLVRSSCQSFLAALGNIQHRGSAVDLLEARRWLSFGMRQLSYILKGQTPGKENLGDFETITLAPQVVFQVALLLADPGQPFIRPLGWGVRWIVNFIAEWRTGSVG